MKMNQDERRFDFHGFGLALKQAREAKGWTQAYVAELVGKTDRTIMNIENKGQHPSFNLFFCVIFGVGGVAKWQAMPLWPQTTPDSFAGAAFFLSARAFACASFGGRPLRFGGSVFTGSLT